MAFADITLSPTYTAAIGLVSEDRGLSMRFPRFLKVREDKGIEEASSDEFLADLWWKQEARRDAGIRSGWFSVAKTLLTGSRCQPYERASARFACTTSQVPHKGTPPMLLARIHFGRGVDAD